MKKFLLSLASVALLTGSASAADLLFDLKFGKEHNVDERFYAGNNNYTGTFTYTMSDNETFSVSNFNNNNNGWDFIKCGRKKYDSVGYITTDFMVAEQVTSIELTIPAWTPDKVNSIMLQTATSIDGDANDETRWSTVAIHSATYDDETAKTVTLNNSAPAANRYYRIAFDCVSSTGNGLVSLSEVKYYGEPAGEDVQKPAGFSFTQSKIYTTTKLGATAPELSNPNNVAVTYSSSDPAVVEVAADGTIKVKGEGTAEITATSEESAEYLAGSAKYAVVVAPEALNHDEFMAASKESGDVIYVNFYYTVAYVNGSYIYAASIYDDPVLFFNSGSTYEPGDRLKAGYFVEFSPFNNLPEWKFIGDFPEVFMNDIYTPQKFTSADEVSLNQVCYLANVTFNEETPTEKGKTFKGIMADGSEFTFYTQWALDDAVAPGTYNVYGAMGCYKTTIEFFPISYEVYEADPEIPTSLNITSDANEMSYEFKPAGSDEMPFPTLSVTATTDKESATFEIEVPEGWTTFAYMPLNSDVDIEPLRRAPGINIEWIPVEYLTAEGYVTGNELKIPSNISEYQNALYLVKGTQVCSNVPIVYTFNVAYDINSGVDGINAADDAEAVYYNLSGAKVANPENGVFIKVADGKAEKVVL